MILASMFGNPDPEGRSLIIPGDISLTALNAIITTITDVPVFIDEIGKMKIDSRDGLIYAIGNGKESTRGKTDGSLRSDRMIRCNAVITGEVASVTEFSNNGAHAREYSCSQRPIPLINGRIVVDTKRRITENYGQILPLVLEKIFRLGESGIKKVSEAALNKLYETTQDPIMRRKSVTIQPIKNS